MSRQIIPKEVIPVERFLEVAQGFHWAKKRHFQMCLTGEEKTRNRRIETVLQRLSQRKLLRTARYGKQLVYAVPRKTRGEWDDFAGLSKIAHGLACTEDLVRFYLSDRSGEIIPERLFTGCGSIPEWGIRYPSGTLLLDEDTTKSNFLNSGIVSGKIASYLKNLWKIEEKFQGKAVVLFVIDMPRETVERFVGSLKRSVGSVADGEQSAPYVGDRFPLDPFFFVDYKTFLSVPIGRQLTAPIYIWRDGKSYPLRREHV